MTATKAFPFCLTHKRRQHSLCPPCCRLEALYAMTATKAFQSCLTHKRRQNSLCSPCRRLEALYAMTATKAFQFCLTYKRTTEFRRLCDILRNHLVNLNK